MAIYKFEDKKLKLVSSEPGDPTLPKSFKKSWDNHVFVLEKQKVKVKKAEKQ